MFARLRNRKFCYLPFKFMHTIALSKDDTKQSDLRTRVKVRRQETRAGR